MINETILLLTYYTRREDRDLPAWRQITDYYLGSFLDPERHFVEPLRQIFANVVVVDVVKRRSEIGVAALNREILELAAKHKPKYVLWTSFYFDVFPRTLDLLRRGGAYTVGWFFDDEIRFDNYSRWWIPVLDFPVTNASSAVSKYQAANASCVLAVPIIGGLPVADEPPCLGNENYDVSFVGSRYYADREEFVDALREAGLSVTTFGQGWEQFLPHGEMMNTFIASKINLNLSKSWDAHHLQIKDRIFEACIAGGFVLSEYAPETEKYLEIGKEIVCFSTKSELVEKARYYLQHDDERRAIARAGWHRANAEYTCVRMLERIFGQIEQMTSASPRQLPLKPFKITAQTWPVELRADEALYHYRWGIGCFHAGVRGRGKDSVLRALRLNPRFRDAWYAYLRAWLSTCAPLFPPFARSIARTGLRALRRLLLRG